MSLASRSARFTGAMVFATRFAVIAVKVSSVSARSILVPVDSVTTIGADACIVRFSFASRDLSISEPRVGRRQRRQPAASMAQQ